MATGGSSIYKGFDLIHDYSCSKCEENDFNTEAQHFCPECEHYLCDKCVGIHREYFKKHVVYGSGDIQKWEGFSIDRCDQHGEKLNVHCDDHQELCCHVCVSLKHRQCNSISHLPDLARGFLKKAEFKQLPAAVDKIRSRLDELRNKRMKDQTSLKESYKNILADIKALRKEFNQILDKLEKKTVEKLNSMTKDINKSLKDDIQRCAYMNDQLKTMMDKLKQITGKNKETNSYIGHTKCQTKLTEAKKLEHEIQGKPEEALSFESDSSILTFLRTLDTLGATKRLDYMVKMSDSVYKVQESKKYYVKKGKYEKHCDIVGLCELPNGYIVIADRNNKRVKLLNTRYKVTAYCDLPAAPENICYLAGNEIAVPIDDGNETHAIYILTVTTGQLQVLRKFTTDYSCTSVSHHQGKLYVGSSTALYQYTIDGRLVNKIYDDVSADISVWQSAVSPDGERIYITKFSANELITLDVNGQVLSSLRDSEMKYPSGLCVSPSGHVFVCGLRSHTVVQVDREGRQKLATVARKSAGLVNPQSMWFSERTTCLIVGNIDLNRVVVVKLNENVNKF